MNAQIYIINLDPAAREYEALRKSLEATEIPVERFPGVDGRKLSPGRLREVAAKNRFYRPLLKTEIGCYLSHRLCLEKIASGSADFGLVFEDDAVLHESFASALARLLDDRAARKTQWELLKLSDCGKNYVNKFGNAADGFSTVECHPIPARFLAQVWTRSGAAKFLKRYTTVSRPVDIDIKFSWEHRICVENVFPDLVFHSGVPSSIGDRETLPKSFVKKLLFQTDFVLRRFFWALRKYGVWKTLSLEWRGLGFGKRRH
jgi:glycosyl transferase family 25